MVRRDASNEFVFALVGHTGSGTSVIAQTLQALLRDTNLNGSTFDVTILKAREGAGRHDLFLMPW